MITTTHGPIDETQLARTVGFEDRPGELVVWVEWRPANHHQAASAVGTPHPDYPRAQASGPCSCGVMRTAF